MIRSFQKRPYALSLPRNHATNRCREWQVTPAEVPAIGPHYPRFPRFPHLVPPARKRPPARAGAAEHRFAMTRLLLPPPHQCAKPAHSSQQRDHAAGFRNAVGSDIRGVDVDRIGSGECEGLGQRLLLDQNVRQGTWLPKSGSVPSRNPNCTTSMVSLDLKDIDRIKQVGYTAV